MTLAVVQAISAACNGSSSSPTTNWTSTPTNGNLLLALGYVRVNYTPLGTNGWQVYQYSTVSGAWNLVLYYKFASSAPKIEAIDPQLYQEWGITFWEISCASGKDTWIQNLVFSGYLTSASPLTNGPLTTQSATSLVLTQYSGQQNPAGTINWSGASGWTMDGSFVASVNNYWGVRNWATGGHQAVTGGATVTATITTSPSPNNWNGSFVELAEVPPPNVRVSGTTRETLYSPVTQTRVSSLPREVLYARSVNVRVGSVTREALYSRSINSRVSSVVREVLVSFPLVPNYGTAAGIATVNGRAPIGILGLASGHATVNGVSNVIPSSAGAVIGRSRVVGIAQAAQPQVAQFPFPTLQYQIGSYLYVWCNDDDNLQSMVAAYNAYAQSYLDWFNKIYLPIYTNGTISDTLLDWVGTNLYGISRPGLPFPGKPGRGPFNTFTLNSLTFNGGHPGTPGTFFVTSDDYYKRILTWLFYKGDGKVFNVRWLKRRVERFLTGLNGTDPGVVTTYDVSVRFTGLTTVTIAVAPSPAATILQAAIQSGVLELPFQITWTVVT